MTDSHEPMRADHPGWISEIAYKGTTISSADAAEFLNWKAAGPQACQVCAEDRWLTAFGYGDGSFSMIPSGKVGDDGKLVVLPEHPPLPLFAVVCASCGYARMFAMAILRDWVEDGRKTE
ncbi:hypothetical protein LDO31_02845 [Luteimonas sp. XNQY3]|nr:hypothetical protein [Luteimonas sp. XNQY3]MCD9005184.1 hypothetical protein [Luteimonas sp. XNQY3]